MKENLLKKTNAKQKKKPIALFKKILQDDPSSNSKRIMHTKLSTSAAMSD